MLNVPRPHFKPLSYSTIMVDLCKLMPTFPRSMSACVRECFARMHVMDPELRPVPHLWLCFVQPCALQLYNHLSWMPTMLKGLW